MAETAPLDVYLNDHLAGSAAAVELVERIRDNNQGTPIAAHMEKLALEIEKDRDTLGDVMERLGVVRSTPQQVAGKVLETLSRLRLNQRITGNADVTRLLELETLSLGIEGKLQLWRALSEVAQTRPELGEFDLAALATQAVSQRAGVEPFRLEAAAAALSPGGE
ncbi:MAG TPA: hypothetical protein VNT52_08525 [Acidimicrobiales bacterium]|nr:hypothetical protein [Acidimicrobiales bacterium]